MDSGLRFLGAVFLLASLWWLSRPAPLPVYIAANNPSTEADIRRGEYMVNIAGCVSCHTDADNGGAHLAGGVKLDTPFGSFFAPNITSNRETGIGGWSFADFAGAMHLGITPHGSTLLPCISIYILHTNSLFRPARHV